MLTVQIPPRWHPSQPHPSRPDANGCYRPAPSPPCPNHPHTTPLSQHGKGDLTQKWVETNDSNESHCPPANVCRHYRCPCKWLQMALFLAWQTAAPLHWTSTRRGKFLPESSCEPCVLKSSQDFFFFFLERERLINRFVSFVVFERDAELNLHWFQVHKRLWCMPSPTLSLRNDIYMQQQICFGQHYTFYKTHLPLQMSNY